jgi:gas vesicle protein
MSDSNPNESKPKEESISEQLNELGNNLRDALHAAWTSEERRKLQQDIETGLASLGASLSQAAKDFSSTPTGQTLKDDVKDLQERWRNGEVGSKVHSEVVDALRKVNDELQKAARKNTPPPPDQPSS